MAISNNERVGKGLEQLKVGLMPFVEREFRSRFGESRAHDAKDLLSYTGTNGGTNGVRSSIFCSLACRVSPVPLIIARSWLPISA